MTEPPIRPFDLRLVPAALAAWSATVVGILGGWVVGLAVAGGWALVAVSVGCARRRLDRITAGALAVAAIGSCYACAAALHAWQVESSPVTAAAANRAWVSAVVTVTEDPRRVRSPGPETVSVMVEFDRVDIAGRTTSLGGRARVMAPADGWDHMVPGQTVTLRGRVSPPQRSDLTVAVVRVNGPPLVVDSPGAIAASASRVRSELSSAAADSLSADRAGVLPGLVVGDVSALSEDVENDFRAAGLTHLTAVSGANFAIVLGAVVLVARAVGIGPRATVAVCAVVLVAFVVVARPSPSVLRAAVMGAIGLLSLVTGRRRQAVPALCTAVLGLIVWWPELAVDIGFALSVAATAGLVLVAPVWVDWLREHGWGRATAEIVAVAAAAHAVTAPLVAGISGTFSVVGILSNIAVAPVIAPITVVGATAAVIAPWAGGLASLVLMLTSAPLWWLIAVAHWSASLPVSAVATPGGVAGACSVGVVTVGLLVSLRSRILRWAIAVGTSALVAWWCASSLL